VSDLGVDAVLVIATEVDDAVLALVATTDVTGRDAALVVATTGLGERAQQRLLGRRSGDLGEVGHRRTAATRGRGLVLANSHVLVLYPDRQPTAVKMSMVPDFSVTIARLVSLRLPVPKRVRRDLPGRLSVLTAATLTAKIFSMASLISVLVARGSTRNVYLPSSMSP